MGRMVGIGFTEQFSLRWYLSREGENRSDGAGERGVESVEREEGAIGNPYKRAYYTLL